MTQNRRQDDVLIGRIDERLKGLDKSFGDHIEEDRLRFELVFSHMKDRFDKIDKKLETLWDQNNRSQGAFGAGRMVAGAMWAVAAVVASYFINRIA